MTKKNAMTQAHLRAKLADIRASQHQRDELARRKRMGIALIQRPLRYFKDKTGKESGLYLQSRAMADSGYGDFVKSIARSLNHGN